jgi:hypothetical protein
MNKRPLSVIIIACVYIATSVIGVVYHLTEFKTQHPFQYDIVLIELVSLAAIIAGVFMLRGHNWARWLAIAWIAFHVVLSAFHSFSELGMHTVLLVVFAFFLFRPAANRYFHGGGAQAG